jgi:plasmid stabilization system protein ParE
MAARRRRVIWTEQAKHALDEALEYVATESPSAARQLLLDTLEAAKSLALMSDRGRVVPEVARPTIREIFVQRYRLLCDVRDTEVRILALLLALEISLRGAEREALTRTPANARMR